MSGVKVRHAAGKLQETELPSEEQSSEDEEEVRSYDYCVLLRNFLYALVVCALLSSIILSQVTVMQSRRQQHLQAGGTHVVMTNRTKDIMGAANSGNSSELRQSVEKIVQSALNKISFSDSSRSVSTAPTLDISSSIITQKTQRKCADQWSPQRLTGRCYGLKPHSEFPQLKNVRRVKSSVACEELCCRLGSACQTWQYWIDLQVCKVGGLATIKETNVEKNNVAQGRDDTGPWCEQDPPLKWRGRRVISRDEAGVIRSQENLDTKCFGLKASLDSNTFGRSETNISGGGDYYKEKSCQMACGNDNMCAAWQFHTEVGCFLLHSSDSKSLLCEPYVGEFDGGMKMRII